MNRMRLGQQQCGKRLGGTLELMESCILLTLKKQAGHGYEIARSLDKHGMCKRGLGPLYTILNKMEERGLIKSQWDTSTKHGPARRIYEITEGGVIHLEGLVAILQETLKTVSSVIDEFKSNCDEKT
ncbi:MAG: helix-turn-helix transcriptional regulator [Nitrospirae bacterium]|nr:helix-turn-helix transcriptional regulator [Nitrospirota bacterium]